MAAEYKVLKITELTRMAESGGLEHYYRHQIRTKGGTVLTVDIDEKNFIAEKSAPILLKRAQEADKILNL